MADMEKWNQMKTTELENSHLYVGVDELHDELGIMNYPEDVRAVIMRAFQIGADWNRFTVQPTTEDISDYVEGLAENPDTEEQFRTAAEKFVSFSFDKREKIIREAVHSGKLTLEEAVTDYVSDLIMDIIGEEYAPSVVAYMVENPNL